MATISLWSTKESLKEKSDRAISVFKSVVEDLKLINQNSLTEQNALNAEVLSLQKQVLELENISAENSKVISNIEKIFK